MAIGSITNRYESGMRFGTARRWLHGFVQDARYDADQATRWEIIRKSRYFEQNSGLMHRLCDLFEQYTVGPNGLQMIPASSDPAWNLAASAWWKQWCKYPDACSRQPLAMLQSLVARLWFVDGECFILKTYGKDAPDRPAWPRIQIIETHRVGTPGDSVDQEGKTMFDGVRLDQRGRPIGFWVKDGFSDEKYRPISADMLIQVFEPSRPGMYHGLPMSYAVLNDFHDLDDLQLLEMQAAKQAAQESLIIKTKTGELESEEDYLRAGNNPLAPTNLNPQRTDGPQTKNEYYESVFGARARVMQHDDDIQQLVSQRPSVAVQAYWDFMLSKICAGVGISKLLVYPSSMQGTVVRADLDTANAFFRSRSAVLAAAFTEVYLFVMDWATKNVQELSEPPVDWREVTVRPPRAVNVDIGRNSQAMLAELKAGTRNYPSIFAEQGEDWKVELRKAAEAAKLIHDLAIEFGVEPQEIADHIGVVERLGATVTDPSQVGA